MIVYIVLVLVLQFISYIIVYPICKIFVKKPPKGQRKRLAGGLVSLAMSLVMCIAVFAPLGGLLGNVGELLVSVQEVSKIADDANSSYNDDGLIKLSSGNVVFAEEDNGSGNNGADDAMKIISDIGLDTYKTSFIGKFYSFTGGWFFKAVSTVKDEKTGKKTNFDAQIGALNGAIKLATEVMEISKMDFETMFTSGNSDDLIASMAKLDELKDDLTAEQKEALTDMVKNTITEILPSDVQEELGIDFSNFDISEISFESEAKLFTDISKLSGNSEGVLTDAELTTLVDDFANSKIMLSVLDKGAGSELQMDLEPSQKSVVENAIKNGNYDNKTKESLSKLFGID